MWLGEANARYDLCLPGMRRGELWHRVAGLPQQSCEWLRARREYARSEPLYDVKGKEGFAGGPLQGVSPQLG